MPYTRYEVVEATKGTYELNPSLGRTDELRRRHPPPASSLPLQRASERGRLLRLHTAPLILSSAAAASKKPPTDGPKS